MSHSNARVTAADVDLAFFSRVEDWQDGMHSAIDTIRKPPVAKDNPFIATLGLLHTGMSAASVLAPAAVGAPLTIPLFVLSQATALFEDYHNKEAAKGRAVLAKAEKEVKAELKNKITAAKLRLLSDPKYSELKRYLAGLIEERGFNPVWARQNAHLVLESARIRGINIIPNDSHVLNNYVDRHYAKVCRDIYTIYKAVTGSVRDGVYPPFIRAGNRTGVFEGIGELQAFCSKKAWRERDGLVCTPDVEGYVVRDKAKSGKESDFVVLRSHAWLIKLVSRDEYVMPGRATPLPVTHMEIVPIKRKPLQPLWTGEDKTRLALRRALDEVVGERTGAA